MGAERDECIVKAKIDEEAGAEFAKIIESRAWMHGHAGYTGTFAEKESVKILPKPNGQFWQKDELEELADERSKWDDPVGGQISEIEYFICGWCSA